MPELHVYDFDGTLFRSPEKPDWWGGKFWWFDPQSLDEPCVPEKPGGDWWIGSTVSQAKKSIADPNVWAILMTGRSDKRFRWRVPELLKSKGLKFDEVHLAPSKDLAEYFKVSIVKGILRKHPFIEKVRFWDDNVRNLGQFQKAVEDTGREVEINPVKVPAHPLLCTPEQMESVQRVASIYRVASAHLSAKRVATRWLQAQSKTACIIAAGNWGGHKCLFKSRDRRYNPKVSIYHEIQNGVEVLYMKDEFTGWCEGLNEHHVGVVNTALDVIHDENEKDIILKDTLGHTPRNGKRILKALTKKTAKAAADSIKTFDGGLKGHTFVADLSDILSLEATEDHEYHERQLSTDQKHVRTNHGQKHQDAGYTEDDEENYLSSLARRDQAMKVLRGVDKPTGLAPAIYGKRKKDHSDPLNMVKLTDGMRTSTQMVMDLTDLTAHLYLLPKMVKFLGYKKDLPKDYKPKLTLKVYEYEKLDDKGDFKTKPKKLAVVTPDAGAEFLSAKLTPMARSKLLRAFPALHGEVRADHMTVWYDPPERILGKLEPMVGKKVKLKVIGYAEDEKGQAVVIGTRLPTKNRIPHVTLSFAGGAKAVYSNQLLSQGYQKVVGPTLDAILTIDK